MPALSWRPPLGPKSHPPHPALVSCHMGFLNMADNFIRPVKRNTHSSLEFYIKLHNHIIENLSPLPYNNLTMEVTSHHPYPSLLGRSKSQIPPGGGYYLDDLGLFLHNHSHLGARTHLCITGSSYSTRQHTHPVSADGQVGMMGP